MNNAAAIGYALMAGIRIGMTKDQLKELEKEMYVEMDVSSVKEAEDYYLKF